MVDIFAGRVVRVSPNRDVVNSPPQFDFVQVKVRVGVQRLPEFCGKPRSAAFRYFVIRRTKSPKMGSHITVTLDASQGTATIEGSATDGFVIVDRIGGSAMLTQP